MTFYLVQIISILFAVYLGRHDAPAANKFSDVGSTPSEQAKFHSNGFRLKVSVVAGLALLCAPDPSTWVLLSNNDLLKDWIGAILGGIACAFWVWMIFDPVINKARKRGFDWHYLGKDNGVDLKLTKWFGSNAGQIKAIFCWFMVLATNVVYLFL